MVRGSALDAFASVGGGCSASDIVDQDDVSGRIKFKNDPPRSDPSAELPLVFALQSDKVAGQWVDLHLVECSVDACSIIGRH